MTTAAWSAGAVALLLVLQVTGARAQSQHVWVSTDGDDVTPCTYTSPCKTFAGAISKVAAGGRISVLKTGSYGGVTITKSVSIVAEGVEALVMAAPGGFGINVRAGVTDVVRLRGLTIDGGTTGLNGIVVSSAFEVHIEQCSISRFQGTGGFGIAFQPTTFSTLYVADSTISDNGGGPNGGGGIGIAPPANSGAAAILDRVRVNASRGPGIQADGTYGAAAVQLLVRESVVAGMSSDTGISIIGPTGSQGVSATLDRSVVVRNRTGVSANGSAASLYFSNATITGNDIGMVATNGGGLISYRNNNLGGNAHDSGPTRWIVPE